MGIAGGPPRARLQSIQVLRGIAALLVLFTHSINAVSAVQSDSAVQGDAPFFIASLGQFRGFGAVGVDLFFVISGFVMAFSVAGKPDGPHGAGYFLRLRWIRIAPPYLIITAALVVMLALRGAVDPKGIANAVLFVPLFDTEQFTDTPLSIGWTLSFEFSFYLLIALGVLLHQSRRIEVVGVVIVLLVAAGMIVPPDSFLLQWFTNPIFLEFALGILAYAVWSRGWLDRARLLWGAFGAIAVGVLITGNMLGFGRIAEMHYTLSGELSLERVVVWGVPCLFVFVGAVSVWRPGRGVVSRAFTGLGDASYSVYLVHLPVVFVVARLLVGRLHWQIPSDLLFVILVAAGVLAGVVYYRLIEKPVTRVLRAWSERRERARAVGAGRTPAA